MGGEFSYSTTLPLDLCKVLASIRMAGGKFDIRKIKLKTDEKLIKSHTNVSESKYLVQRSHLQ
jgi:hypothetical protein